MKAKNNGKSLLLGILLTLAVCGTDFLREASPPVRYLVPNLCFAMLHLFARTGWGRLGADEEHLTEKAEQAVPAGIPAVFPAG